MFIGKPQEDNFELFIDNNIFLIKECFNIVSGILAADDYDNIDDYNIAKSTIVSHMIFSNTSDLEELKDINDDEMEVFIDFVKNLSVQYIIWQCEKKNYIENTGDGKYRLTEIGQKKILNR
jgi:hypothetical protein